MVILRPRVAAYGMCQRVPAAMTPRSPTEFLGRIVTHADRRSNSCGQTIGLRLTHTVWPVLPSQTKGAKGRMSAYVVASIEVTDPDTYQQYM